MSTKIAKSVTSGDAQHDRLKSSRENVRSNSVSEGFSGLVQQAFTPSSEIQPEAVLTLLRKAGNQAVTHLLARRRIQPKLLIGATNDAYEQEADRVAEQVMRMPAQEVLEQEKEVVQAKSLAVTIKPLLQRQSAEEEEELGKKSTAGEKSFEPGVDFESRLATISGSGSPLPSDTREFMEQRFGADFRGVRLHTGSETAQLNREIGAQAFTQGQDIYLREGKENIASKDGKYLLAHELSHVIQQSQISLGLRMPLHTAQQKEGDEEVIQTKPLAATKKSMIQQQTTSKERGLQVKPRVGNDSVIQRMAAVPEVRQQTGGTCGCFSLWMAIESLFGAKQDDLIGLILQAARDSGSKLGENFSYDALANLVKRLNRLLLDAHKGFQVIINRVPFANQEELYGILIGSPPTEALLIAYGANALYLDPNSPVTSPGQDAHWSLIESLSAMYVVNIVNPWGEKSKFFITQIMKANNTLGPDDGRLSIGYAFDWQGFASKQLTEDAPGHVNEGNRSPVDVNAEGIGKEPGQVRKLLVNIAGSKKEDVREPIDLRGFVVSIKKG